MGAVLETLSNKTKTIIRIYKACLEDVMKKDLEMKSKDALHNWEDIKVKTELNIRCVLEQFEKKRLDPSLAMSRRQKYEKFAHKEDFIDDVRSSDFTPETFADTVVQLYENLNKTAHPIFQYDDTLMVQEEYFSESEWRVLSLIWKLYPLPEGKLEKIKPEMVTTCTYIHMNPRYRGGAKA